jgi:hypothetical protein
MTLIVGETEFGTATVKPISIQFDDFTSVANADIDIFLNGQGTDLSSTHMPSGSIGYSGNIVTTKPITSLSGGKFYMLSVSVEVNGTTQVEHRYVKIWVPKTSSGLVRTK